VYDGVTGRAAVSVTPASLQSISITPATGSVAAGMSLSFKATGKYSDNSTSDLTATVMWVSSNANVATVSNVAASAGVATGKAAGSATISGTYQGVTGSASLNVVAAVLQSIAITPMDQKLKAGSTIAYKAMGLYSDGTTRDETENAVWSSSAPSIATISNTSPNKGVATLTNNANGVTLIDATLGSAYAKTSLTGYTDNVVQVQKVGFNFEDLLLTNSDHDFNDSVLCATGNFKIQGDRVFSGADQNITGNITVLSGCRHYGKVQILNADGSLANEINYDDSTQKTVNLNLRANQELRVMFQSKPGCTTSDK
jgi:hypothetical protein